ncbi:MAG: HD domain-containing phosphohydrolase [Clostridia bacterium]
MLPLIREKKKVRFHISVVGSVLLIMGAMTFSTVSMILSVSRQAAMESAENLFDTTSRAARERTISLLQPAMQLSTMAALIPGVDARVTGSGLDHPARTLFSRLLSDQPAFYSAYLGLEDGTFFQLIKAAGNPAITSAHAAPENTHWILRTITGKDDSRVQHWTFLDLDDRSLGSRTETDFSYDPRTRLWYETALGHPTAVLSEPYVFNSLKQPGITASFALPRGYGVAGVDLTLSSLQEFVSAQEISPKGGMALMTGTYQTIAASRNFEAAMKNFGTDLPAREAILAASESKLINEQLLKSDTWQMAANMDLFIVSAAPLADFMDSANEMRYKILLFTFIILLLAIPSIVYWALRLSRALKELAVDAEKVGRMVFDGQLTVHTPIYEFHQLARGFEVMKSTIADRTMKLEETLMKLEMLVEMGIAMSAEFDIHKLSEMILANAKQLTHADGGSLYLVNEQNDHLVFQIVMNDTLHFMQGGTSGNPVSMHPVPLYNPDGSENHHNVVSHTFHKGKTANIQDAYETGTYDFSGTKAFDKLNNYRSVSFLTVPLKPRGGGKVLGALQLINARQEGTARVIPFSESYQGFIEALSSAAAVAIQNWALMERQKKLFDDLIKFVASAIDAKSPYTARHCARVPEIANILAREAGKVQTGPLADFRLASQDEQREFNVAAWLHDCGKVTTPEYVVDKATKLETIYNRIHEIRTRFEVLLRDARIARHEAVLAGADPAQEDRILAQRETELRDDFAFVAECNVGSEYMGDKALARLHSLAKTPWRRHFDKHLGLSWGEMHKFGASPGAPTDHGLPVTEQLIADLPEHIIHRENGTRETYRKFGFSFDVPDCLYNRGELYNLSIRRGTLTAEERFKIDEHVAQTIVMLEHIPFPEDLAQVPVLAGRHHELPDGSGYPRRLDASELSIPDRILATADIFEALTSVDRPYKKSNTLSEAVDILFRMKQEGLVDPDIFELLLRSGAYKEYADKFLQPYQVDSVDLDKYLS